MMINKKVPLNCNSEGTSNLFKIGVINNNANNLYHIIVPLARQCLNSRINRSSKWPNHE